MFFCTRLTGFWVELLWRGCTGSLADSLLDSLFPSFHYHGPWPIWGPEHPTTFTTGLFVAAGNSNHRAFNLEAPWNAMECQTTNRQTPSLWGKPRLAPLGPERWGLKGHHHKCTNDSLSLMDHIYYMSTYQYKEAHQKKIYIYIYVCMHVINMHHIIKHKTHNISQYITIIYNILQYIPINNNITIYYHLL